MRSTRAFNILCCCAAILVVFLLERVRYLAVSAPIQLFGDHAFLLSPARQMMEGQGFWGSSIIGYPIGQESVYWPGFEPLLKLVLLMVSQTGLGVFAVAKVFYLVGLSFMTAAAFWGLRSLSIRPWLAAFGAILFVVSPYFAVRSANHDFISIYGSAAIGGALSLLVLQKQTEEELYAFLRSWRFILPALIVSTCGIYYAFFSLMLLNVATLVFAHRTRRLLPLAVMAAISLAMLAVLLVGGLGPAVFSVATAGPRRLSIEQIYHGLSIADVIFSLDWVPGIKPHINSMSSWRPTTLVGEGRGEWPTAVISVVILASPLLALAGMNRAPPNRYAATALWSAALICLLLIFSARGGLGYLMNELLSPSLRAQARVMPFLMFFAILIICCGLEIALRGRLWAKIVAVCFIPIPLVLAWALPGSLGSKQIATLSDARAVQTIAQFHGMLAAKDARGLRTVLQLPIGSWPEIPARNGFDFYMHHYAFVFDRSRSPTRWSYGSSLRQPGFPELKATIRAEYDPPGLAARARDAGFDGILIEKAAFTAAELARLLDGLKASVAAACLVYDGSDRVLFDVGATSACYGKRGAPIGNPLSISFRGAGEEFTGPGFYPAESGGTWAVGRSSALAMPLPPGVGPIRVKMAFDFYKVAAKEKRLTIRIGGEVVADRAFDLTEAYGKSLEFEVPDRLLGWRQVVRLDLSVDAPESPASTGVNDQRDLALYLKIVDISRLDGGA